MSELINVSICTSDIPKERIKLADNGKKYMNIVVATRREQDAYGNTHTVYMSQSKEERENKVQRTYIGYGKAVVFSPTPVSAEDIEQMPSAPDTDDLPF